MKTITKLSLITLFSAALIGCSGGGSSGHNEPDRSANTEKKPLVENKKSTAPNNSAPKAEENKPTVQAPKVEEKQPSAPQQSEVMPEKPKTEENKPTEQAPKVAEKQPSAPQQPEVMSEKPKAEENKPTEQAPKAEEKQPSAPQQPEVMPEKPKAEENKPTVQAPKVEEKQPSAPQQPEVTQEIPKTEDNTPQKPSEEGNPPSEQAVTYRTDGTNQNGSFTPKIENGKVIGYEFTRLSQEETEKLFARYGAEKPYAKMSEMEISLTSDSNGEEYAFIVLADNSGYGYYKVATPINDENIVDETQKQTGFFALYDSELVNDPITLDATYKKEKGFIFATKNNSNIAKFGDVEINFTNGRAVGKIVQTKTEGGQEYFDVKGSTSSLQFEPSKDSKELLKINAKGIMNPKFLDSEKGKGDHKFITGTINTDEWYGVLGAEKTAE